MDKNNFEKISDKMVVTFDGDSLGDFITILQDKFNVSVSLKPKQFALIKSDIQKRLESNTLELETLELEIDLEFGDVKEL